MAVVLMTMVATLATADNSCCKASCRPGPQPSARQLRQSRRKQPPSWKRRTRTAIFSLQTDSVVLIDNYDSFTYNLSQYLGQVGCDHQVIRNDDISIDELSASSPRGIIISPGPGRPEDSGISLQVVKAFGPKVPLFGVCMGHQCIGQAYGGSITRAPCGVMHGKSSLVYHTQKGVLENMTVPFQAARYHSLVISRDGFPHEELEITAWSDDETIMAVQHKEHSHIQGVQFHPESIITDGGLQIVEKFLSIVTSGVQLGQ